MIMHMPVRMRKQIKINQNYIIDTQAQDICGSIMLAAVNYLV